MHYAQCINLIILTRSGPVTESLVCTFRVWCLIPFFAYAARFLRMPDESAECGHSNACSRLTTKSGPMPWQYRITRYCSSLHASVVKYVLRVRSPQSGTLKYDIILGLYVFIVVYRYWNAMKATAMPGCPSTVVCTSPYLRHHNACQQYGIPRTCTKVQNTNDIWGPVSWMCITMVVYNNPKTSAHCT